MAPCGYFFVEHGVSYLGALGDVRDSQKDMDMSLLGVVVGAFTCILGTKVMGPKEGI